MEGAGRQGGGAGRRRLKSGRSLRPAQLEGKAPKVSLLDFGEVGLKDGDKAVCLLVYNTNWVRGKLSLKKQN